MRPLHGYFCPSNPCPIAADAARQASQPRIWERTLRDNTTLIGVVGDGTHTHYGATFAVITDEKTRQHPFKWRLPLADD